MNARIASPTSLMYTGRSTVPPLNLVDHLHFVVNGKLCILLASQTDRETTCKAFLETSQNIKLRPLRGQVTLPPNSNRRARDAGMRRVNAEGARNLYKKFMYSE